MSYIKGMGCMVGMSSMVGASVVSMSRSTIGHHRRMSIYRHRNHYCRMVMEAMDMAAEMIMVVVNSMLRQEDIRHRILRLMLRMGTVCSSILLRLRNREVTTPSTVAYRSMSIRRMVSKATGSKVTVNMMLVVIQGIVSSMN